MLSSFNWWPVTDVFGRTLGTTFFFVCHPPRRHPQAVEIYQSMQRNIPEEQRIAQHYAASVE